MKDRIKQIVNLIDKSKRILITSHKDPDGDSIGSQLALAELLKRKNKQFKIMNQGQMPIKYHFLDQDSEIITRPPKKFFKADLVIILECNNLDRIGWVKDVIYPEAKIITIDHHSEENYCGTINYSDPLASAVGEMIYDIFEYLNYPLDAKTATRLYSAILTDTGRFRFINTTPRCLEVCANLIRSGANPKFITDRIYFEHHKSYMQILGYLLTHMEFFEDNRICCLTLKQSTMKKYGIASAETEGLVNYALYVKGVIVGFILSELGQSRVHVGLRSQGQFNVSRLAKSFGGGGHKNASGCTIPGNLQEVKKLLIKKIKMEFGRELGRSTPSK